MRGLSCNEALIVSYSGWGRVCLISLYLAAVLKSRITKLDVWADGPKRIKLDFWSAV